MPKFRQRKGNIMIVELQILIVFICMIGSSYTCWKIGQKEGINAALSWLEDAGILDFKTMDEGESSL